MYEIANRKRIGCPAPFNAGNNKIMFVHSYCYLGCIINDELSITNEWLYMKAERNICMYVR